MAWGQVRQARVEDARGVALVCAESFVLDAYGSTEGLEQTPAVALLNGLRVGLRRAGPNTIQLVLYSKQNRAFGTHSRLAAHAAAATARRVKGLGLRFCCCRAARVLL
jgi:hypothetical protein